MMLILKTDYFQLWFLYKINWRISTVGKHIQILELNGFQPRKQQYCIHSIHQIEIPGRRRYEPCIAISA